MESRTFIISSSRAKVFHTLLIISVVASVAVDCRGDQPAADWERLRRQFSRERVPHLRLQKMLDAAIDLKISPDVRVNLCGDLLANATTDSLRARACLAKSDGLMQLGKSAASLEAASEALQYAKLADHTAIQICARYRIGRAQAELGRCQDAKQTLLECLSLGHALPAATEELATCYLTLATLAHETDEHLAAIEYCREAFELGQQLDATEIRLATSINLCGMLADRGNLDQAADWLRKAQTAALASADSRLAFALQFCEWDLRIKRGEELDLTTIRHTLAEAGETIDHELRATALGILADAERRQGAWSDSIASFRKAIEELQNYPRPLTEARLGLARVLVESGDLTTAQQTLADIDPHSITTERQLEYWELQTLLSIQQADSQLAAASLRQLEACHRAKYARETSQQVATQEVRLQAAEKDRELSALRHAQAAEKAHAAEARAQAMQSRTLRNMIAIVSLAILGSASLVIRGRSTRRIAERLRDQQQSLNAELQHVLETQTASLRREMESRRQLQNALHHKQRHEAIGKLTGGVAHDFNNLLTAIINANSTLRKRLPRRIDKELRELLEAIDEAAKLGAEIVQALLTYARQQPLRATTVNLHEYFGSTRSLFRSILGDGMQLASLNKLGPDTSIRVDRGRLTTSIINLLTNARDACKGHGYVSISLDHVTLCPQSKFTWSELPWGPYVSITVRDDGCGMPPEALTRAFEPFFSSKTQEAGTGLGLSVVYGFVKQSHGDVHIQSSACGTIVTLLFPQAACQPDAIQPTVAVAEGLGELVLLVDDNQLVRVATAKLLAASGFDVREARDAAEAIQLIDSGTIPNVVLTDVVMPGELDGLGLAHWLQQRYPEVRVVLCSGYGHNNPHGEFDLVCKPYTNQELVSKLLNS